MLIRVKSKCHYSLEYIHLFRHREYTSNSEEPTDIQNTDDNMSRRMIVPPEGMNQHHYTPASPAQSFNQTRQQPMPTKKTVQNEPDMYMNMRHVSSISTYDIWHILVLHSHVHFKCLKVGYRIVRKQCHHLLHQYKRHQHQPYQYHLNHQQ
jgi:hypothetical protein